MGNFKGSSRPEHKVGVTPVRPKLLFLCQTLPFPPDGGVNIRTYNILRLLSLSFDVHAVCFYRRSIANSVESSVAGLKPFVSTMDVFPIEQEYSKFRLFKDHLASTVRRKVYTRFAYENGAAKNRIHELMASERFALVHCDSLDLSGYLPLVSSIPIICVHHNVESALLKRRAQVESNSARRRYIRMQGQLMEQEEREWCSKVALNIVCSPDDRTLLKLIAPDARVSVVPNGVDIVKFLPANEPNEGVVFVGGMTWFPNKDALSFFTDSILGLLKKSGVLPRVVWVGRASPDAILTYKNHGIELTGYVDDIRPFVHGGRCFIVPLRVGGGTRLKILDAWAMGKAVVSTTIGCEGLDAIDGYNILIRDSPPDFAKAVLDVLENAELRETLERNARATVESTYSWDFIGKEMIASYAGVLEKSQVLLA